LLWVTPQIQHGANDGGIISYLIINAIWEPLGQKPVIFAKMNHVDARVYNCNESISE